MLKVRNKMKQTVGSETAFSNVIRIATLASLEYIIIEHKFLQG